MSVGLHAYRNVNKLRYSKHKVPLPKNIIIEQFASHELS